jgi:hypothetical protein
MQVFFPTLNMFENAKILDYRRHNKQIIEIIQIIAVNSNDLYLLKKWNIIKPIGNKYRFKLYKSIKNHTITKLYKNHTAFLYSYLNVLIYSWIFEKKYNGKKYLEIYNYLYKKYRDSDITTDLPEFITAEFCKQHQNKLLEKDYNHYSKFFRKD